LTGKRRQDWQGSAQLRYIQESQKILCLSLRLTHDFRII
jgi:hypothetical protein